MRSSIQSATIIGSSAEPSCILIAEAEASDSDSDEEEKAAGVDEDDDGFERIKSRQEKKKDKVSCQHSYICDTHTYLRKCLALNLIRNEPWSCGAFVNE